MVGIHALLTPKKLPEALLQISNKWVIILLCRHIIFFIWHFGSAMNKTKEKNRSQFMYGKIV